ncbi:MAG: hypothetical protein AB1458_12690, partial [Bacteroidota bacterium]
ESLFSNKVFVNKSLLPERPSVNLFLHICQVKMGLYTKICLGGMAFTLLVAFLLTFAGIPFYMTGHLILPWIVALLARKLIQKP